MPSTTKYIDTIFRVIDFRIIIRFVFDEAEDAIPTVVRWAGDMGRVLSGSFTQHLTDGVGTTFDGYSPSLHSIGLDSVIDADLPNVLPTR